MNLPMAQPPQAEPEQSELLLPTMALSNDFELLGQGADSDPEVPGCFLTVRCDGDPDQGRPCGQKFLVDLLDTSGAKRCPRCGAKLVHALLVARDDDPTILEEAFLGITRANGLGLRDAQALARGVNPGPGDDDQGDDAGDDEDDDDAGDDAGDAGDEG